MRSGSARSVLIPVQGAELAGELAVPPDPGGLVMFAHGSGSSRHSPRNQHVARLLGQRGLATLLLDLLSPAEEAVDVRTAEFRFDVELLGRRLAEATDWVSAEAETTHLGIGYFGASTGAAAALLAAGERTHLIRAIVSRGGRPDLAGAGLERVRAPTLFIVGSLDVEVLELNRRAADRLGSEHEIRIVEGASHLFEEPGKLDEVAALAGDWFASRLGLL